ncbi:unnamed protein product [Echinostoma caproni]|uniref:Cytochrome P450 n=1 Tax=Echinostoma caproni TaxID=27848 RepID=A0A183AA63_9TREM|nr:unnamed protein product [Echinostoma caproni]
MKASPSDSVKAAVFSLQPITPVLNYGSRWQRFGCEWPPKSVENIRNPKTGLFNLAIQPCVGKQNVKHHSDTWWERYYKLLNILYPGNLPNGSLTHRARIMERKLRVNPAEYNFQLYPQLIDVKETVSLIRQGQEVFRVLGHWAVFQTFIEEF